MDLAELIQQYCMPIIVLICLVIGYVIKKLDFVPDKFIPLIMFILGSIFGFIVKGFSFDSFVLGAVSGVASTGMHQLFKQLIEKDQDDDR